jgi:hypothetical protein
MNHRPPRNPRSSHAHRISTNNNTAATRARRKRPRYFLVRGVPFLVLITCVALAVTFVTALVLRHFMSTTTTTSYSLVDLWEDFCFYETTSSIPTRPWRNTKSRTISGDSPSSTLATAADKDDNVVVPWVIFYHIYIPPRKGKVGQTKALEVVAEQLVQIAASRNLYMAAATTSTAMNSTLLYTTVKTTATHHPAAAVWTVYYTTTGVPNVITASWMRRQCQAQYLKCIPTEPHLLVGDEDVTLNHLYDYCQYRNTIDNDNDNDNHTSATATENVVVYLHTKGTHHSAQGRNDAWRRHLTAAVTHPDCLTAVASTSSSSSSSSYYTTTKKLLDKSCDVCGLQYASLWFRCFIHKLVFLHKSPLIIFFFSSSIYNKRPDFIPFGPRFFLATFGRLG